MFDNIHQCSPQGQLAPLCFYLYLSQTKDGGLTSCLVGLMSFTLVGTHHGRLLLVLSVCIALMCWVYGLLLLLY